MLAGAVVGQAEAQDLGALSYSQSIHLQQYLIDEGLLEGKPDGALGRQSRAALSTLLQERGLTLERVTVAELEQFLPEPVSEFEVLEGMDIPEGDYRGGMVDKSLANISLEACQAACNADRICQAYTYNVGAQVCFLKDQVNVPVAFPTAVSGRRLNAAPPVQVVEVADASISQASGAVDDANLCSEPQVRIIPERAPLDPLHGRILSFLNDQGIPLGGFTGDYKDAYDKDGAAALLESYRSHVERSRGVKSDSELGILLFDLVRLYYVADEQDQLDQYFAYRKEAEALLDGLSANKQAADLGASLQVLRRSLAPEDVTQLYDVLANHQRHFGKDPRQWAIFETMTGVAYPFAPDQERLALRDEAYRRRMEWAVGLGDRRLVIDSIGAWIESRTINLPGQERALDDFSSLLADARAIFDEVETRARDDLKLLLPVYETGSNTEPCRSVTTATVRGLMNVFLLDGTAAEKQRVLEFGVLHTLNRNMFGSEPIGVAEMANPLLRLRLVNPDLFNTAAQYLSSSLLCSDGQPRSACANFAFASVYDSLNAGTIALDFARTARRLTHAYAPGSPADIVDTLQLAKYEWDRGSVSAAQDLYAGAVGSLDLAEKDLNFGFRQMVADLGFDLAVAGLDEPAVEQLIVETVNSRILAEEGLEPYDAVSVEGPRPSSMVQRYLLGDACQSCSSAAADAAYRWLDHQLAAGDPAALLLQRLRPLDDSIRMAQAEAYLRRVFGPSPGNIIYDEGALSGVPQERLAALKQPALSSLQLATALALAQLHPQPTGLSEEWAFDFIRFLVEPDVEAKRTLYRMLLQYDSVSLEFGDDTGYLASLANFSRMARLAGYSLAAQVADEHIVSMFDAKLEYLGRDGLETAIEAEDADLVVPALARLARSAYDAGDTKSARRLVERGMQLATSALSGSWETSDQRTVLKYRRLESGLRLSAQLMVRISAQTLAASADAFEALQIAMLGDTALTALASQRRRLLVDDEAREALQESSESNDALTNLQFYAEVVGIGDPVWEANERALRQKRVAAASDRMAALFVNDASLSIEPVSIEELTELLNENEAMLVLHTGSDALYGMLMAPGAEPLSWTWEVDDEALGAQLQLVRAALELQGSRPEPTYPFAEAHQLLRDLTGPAFEKLAEYDRLLVVADGALQSLPLAVLPLDLPERLPETLDDFRNLEIRWLGTEKALLYLPTVSSIRARQQQLPNAGTKPFAGFGDPVFSGSGVVASAEFSGIYDQSGLADQSVLRGLSRLVASRVEVTSLADLSGASAAKDVILGDRATEAAVKGMALEDYRVLLFATHGLTAGQVGGLNEPGLAFSTPRVPSVEDDGYLGLSEVMGLNLSAELVILSACNTAAPDGRTSSPGLSGLARGFLAAGAQSVAVTHWAIPGADVVPLNIAWFRAKSDAAGGDWADALRVAMSEMVSSLGPSRYAHPSYWGAFVVFGAPPG